MRVSLGMAALLGFMVTACSTTGSEAPAPIQTPASAPAAPASESDGPEARIGTLPPQELAPGSCGLYLFMRNSETRRLVFVSDDQSPNARMIIDGKLTNLPRVMAKGPETQRFFPETRYQAAGVKISLSYVPEGNPNLSDGALVREGRLTIEDEAGWSYVMPVAGLIACRPKEG